MGGDSSPVVLFQAIIEAVDRFSESVFFVFVTPQAHEAILKGYPHFPMQQIFFHLAKEVIAMEDEPLSTIRQKKKSSLVEGIIQLRKEKLDGFISLGNTGALIGAAKLLLSPLSHAKRPALLATFPTKQGELCVLDVGGNVSCKASHLVEFARLGVAYQQCVTGIKMPKVGLLNVGIESKKGTAEVRLAYSLLQEENQKGNICFVGNVEGDEVFRGNIDVLVTDGFTGNVFLKTSEGVASFLLQECHDLVHTMHSEKGSFLLQKLQHRFHHEYYNGALVCGVDGIVLKCHGHTSSQGLLSGIQKTVEFIQKQLIKQLKAC